MQNKLQLAFLNILHILNDGYYAVLLLFLPFIAEGHNIGLDKVGVLGSVAVLGSIASGIQIFVTIPAGYFANKFGGIKILIVALFIYSLSFILNIGVDNYFLLFVTFALAGIGFGLFHPIAFASVSRLSDAKHRGTAMANFTAIGDVGRFAFASVITFVIVEIGWNNTSGILGVLGVSIAFFGVLFSKKHFKEKPKAEVHKQKIKFDFKVFKKNFKFLYISLTGFIDSFGSTTLFIFLPFLLSAKGIEDKFLGSMIGIMFIGNVLGKLFLGRLIDKFKNYHVYALSEILMFILIMILVFTNNLTVIIASILLLGAVTKGTVPVLFTMVSLSLDKDKNYEQDMSKYQFLEKIISTTAPVIIGLIGAKLGIEKAFMFLGLTCLVTLVPLWFYSKVE